MEHTYQVIFLPAAVREAQAAVIYFTQRPNLRFFASQGRHVAPIGVKFGMEGISPLLHAKFHPRRCKG